MTRAHRVAVLGPRATRQGLGPWFARAFERAGAEVVAVAGRSQAGVDEAARGFATTYGHEVRGYVGLRTLLEAEPLDCLVIASPNETHEAALELALEHGVSVLCEKPMIWPARPERAGELVAGFAQAGLLLQINTQWPFTLPAYWELYPAMREQPVSRFRMRLSPTSLGAAMLPDALPHPLSLLQALVPGVGELCDIRVVIDADETEAHVAFVYRAGERRVDCDIELVRCVRQPRPAGYGINEHFADRTVELPAYALRFLAVNGQVDVPDPLDLLVADFVDALASGRTPKNCFSPVERIRMLGQIYRCATARS